MAKPTDRSLSIVQTVQNDLVTVTPWPEEVLVEINTPDGALTPEQAVEVAQMLMVAAEIAPHLEWDESLQSVYDKREKPNG